MVRPAMGGRFLSLIFEMEMMSVLCFARYSLKVYLTFLISDRMTMAM